MREAAPGRLGARRLCALIPTVPLHPLSTLLLLRLAFDATARRASREFLTHALDQPATGVDAF